MNFGIPFRKPFGAPFGVPFLGGVTGPVFPTAGNVGYYSAEDISNLGFSSANSVNFIDDQSSASNDLTQGTASANPLFIEHDTVTQFTLANQPTFDYDKIVTQDSSANQPTLVDVGGGELVMEFDDTSYLDSEKILTPNTDFTVEWEDLTYLDPLAFGTLMSSQSTSSRIYGLSGGSNNSMYLTSDNGDLINFGAITRTENAKCVLLKNGNDISFYENDILISTQDCTGYTYSFDRIGRLNATSESNQGKISFYNVAVSDPTNITETPVFELIPNASTMRKDDGTQPIAGDQIQGWHATGAELAVGFDGDYLKKNSSLPSNFTVRVDLTYTGNTFPISRALANERFLFGAEDRFAVYSADNTAYTFAGISSYEKESVIIHKDGNTLSLVVDGDLRGNTYDVSGKSFEFGYIGSSYTLSTKLTSIKKIQQWDSAVSDPTNITETPDFELIPSEDSCNVLAGQQVSRWNATSHKPWLNRLLSDGNDDHLEGMAVQTGDFTYMFKLAFNALSTTEYIFSHTTGLSAVVLLSDNYIYLRDTTGANDIGLTGHTVELGEHVYTITREGNSLKYYVDSCLKETVDVTGRTFELDTFGRPTDSLADLTADWGVWNRALTKEELDYFSYLRSEDTNEILLPPITPDCP